ncbi:MAG TPA: chloride channel protein [Polyangia bacterium]|nr:chloride channel protein [Polyangia bacterium]
MLGGVCGLAAVIFHVSIDRMSKLAVMGAMNARGYSWIPWTLVVPTVGGLVSGVLLQYVVPNARGSGIPQVKVVYAESENGVRLRDAIGKFFVSVIQIGTGSSLGREGPTVHICAGLASGIGRMLRVSPKNLRRLISVGAAAGIAAAFNAPIAAVTFTIEEIIGNLDQTMLSGVIVAAAVAAVVERTMLGENPEFTLPNGHFPTHAGSILLYAVLGVVAALLSLAFTEGLLGLRKRFREQRLLPAWAQPAVGGLATGIMAIFAYGWLKTDGVTGGGYAALSNALAGHFMVKVLLPLCVFKLVATVFSYASGGAGGIFAPALFIGAMAGGGVGAVDMVLFHHSAASMTSFALVGMGAAFAGIIRAPITSVLIIIEMTNGYSLILPLMIANMLAYLIARHFRPTPIYEALLAQDGIQLPSHAAAVHDLDGMSLSQVPLDNEPYISIAVASLANTIAARAASSRQGVYPVVNGGRIVGIIRTEDVVGLSGDKAQPVTAGEIMRPPVTVRKEDDLKTAVETMLANQLRELPVIDENGHVVGFVDETSIARAYILVRQRSAQSD